MKEFLSEEIQVRMKIEEIETGYCKTRDLVKTRAQLIYFQSIIDKPMNGYKVVYIQEI